MPLYTNETDVKSRLVGKVAFDDTDEDPNKVGHKLLLQLIDEGESQLEVDLSPRYAAPFQTDTGGPFSQLPLRPTRNTLKNLAELMAVIRVLETDFGDGSVVDAEKYLKNIKPRYEKLVEKLISRRGDLETSIQWALPPLPNLRLAAHNEMADDGFAGRVLSTTAGVGDFPARQINDPGATFWDGQLPGGPRDVP
jgi:hypothetical protein